MAAAIATGTRHFVYVSVAHHAPVLGPGHRWPALLLPLYWLGALVPLTREGARRLGLVTLAQMLQSLVWAVEHPATARRVLEVPDIRRGALQHT